MKTLFKDGYLDLAKSVTVNGLDGYALPKFVERFKYASKMNDFKKRDIIS